MGEHESFMEEALGLARLGRGWTSPNPVVGAVIVKGGKVVGRGWHREFGGPHAEVLALREACQRAKGAVLYCTLEPCNHTGKTPPCTRALIRAGIARVVLGSRDPNPAAAGGVAALQSAGISLSTGVCEDKCHKLNAPFFKWVSTGLPLVSVKWAMSADGKIATAQRDSKWITQEEARRLAHRLRAQHDAVLVGIGTLLADGPQLNCRLVSAGAGGRAPKQPLRVILDTFARTPTDAPLWNVPDAGAVIVACGHGAPKQRIAALRAKGAGIIQCAAEQERLPVREVLRALAQRGVLSVLVEGGGEVLGAVLDGGLADMAYVFVAPKVIGGREGIPAVGGKGVSRIAEAHALRGPTVHALGEDVLICGVLSAWEYEREPIMDK